VQIADAIAFIDRLHWVNANADPPDTSKIDWAPITCQIHATCGRRNSTRPLSDRWRLPQPRPGKLDRCFGLAESASTWRRRGATAIAELVRLVDLPTNRAANSWLVTISEPTRCTPPAICLKVSFTKGEMP
jgi:hypothetical protein